jgi:hypothetical protein
VTERRRITVSTFWIDRASSNCDGISRNLPAVTEKVAPGGRVELLRLPASGSSIAGYSHAATGGYRAPRRRRSVSVTASPTTVTVHLVGGDVSRVQRATVHSFAAAAIAGSTYDECGLVIPHSATLNGTDYEDD